MDTVITFVIPVLHPENTNNWVAIKTQLSQTIVSIRAQTHSGWRAVIVANEGADLPEVPERFEIIRVNFEPNLIPRARSGMDNDISVAAVRRDKGRRILAGMLSRRDTRFYMTVDADDFISRRLVAFVAKNPTANGWEIKDGYVWGDGGRILFRHDEFSLVCGTSLIVRADLYDLPERFEEAADDYIKTMIGSHRLIGGILAERNTPLATLPFRGAIYRVMHPTSQRNSPMVMKRYCFDREFLHHPRKALRSLLNLQLKTPGIRREYFGK